MSGPRVLVVEDSAVWRAIVRHTLSTIGITPVEVESLETARLQLRSDSFDLLLVDYQLPDGNGLDLLGLGELPAPRFVLITGISDRESLDDRRIDFVDFFLTKPFHSSELLACLGDLGRVTAQQAADEAQPTL